MKEKQVTLKIKKKIEKLGRKDLGSQNDCWLSQNCSAELNFKRQDETGKYNENNYSR